jgi:hypothetical protein
MTDTNISRASGKTVFNGYICDNGFTRPYIRVTSSAGVVENQTYLNSLGSWVALPNVAPGGVKYGECPYQKHVAALAGITLAAGTNTITHNLNLGNTKVGYVAYDVANGNQQVAFDVGTFTANSFQLLNVPVGMAGMIIDIIVTGEG